MRWSRTFLLPPCVADLADGPREETDDGEYRHDDDERHLGQSGMWCDQEQSSSAGKEKQGEQDVERPASYTLEFFHCSFLLVH